MLNVAISKQPDALRSAIDAYFASAKGHGVTRDRAYAILKEEWADAASRADRTAFDAITQAGRRIGRETAVASRFVALLKTATPLDSAPRSRR